MRIQHNIMAMNAYRNYKNNVSAMQKNLEKLSSGYKINRAGDDAAGLAISEKMRAQITGLETAQKNAKDGISLVQTAEGALTEVHDMLNRMVTLATQSANGTYDNETDRVQLQKELDQLRTEIDRIADSSNFNGITLLDGSMDSSATLVTDNSVDLTSIANAFSVYQDGSETSANPAAVTGVYEADLTDLEFKVTNTAVGNVTVALKIGSATIAIGGTNVTPANGTGIIKGSDFSVTVTAGAAPSFAITASVNGNTVTVTFNVSMSGSKITLTMAEAPTDDMIKVLEANPLQLTAALNGTTGSIISNSNSNTDGNQSFTLSVKPTHIAKAEETKLYARGKIDLSKLSVKDGSQLQIDDKTYVFALGSNSQFKNAQNVIDLTSFSTWDADAQRSAAQLIAKGANSTKFRITTPNDDGTIHLEEIKGQVDYSVNNLFGTASSTQDGDWSGLMKFASDAVSSKNGTPLMLQIGETADDFNQLKVEIKDMHCAALGIDSGVINIDTQAGAQNAIDVIKKAINQVSDLRGTLGATQNRLDHTINNLSVMQENIQDAESTIRDTDVAEEMMAYTKNNILIQSAQAMLAQANQVPQGVLQLLQ